MCSETDLRKSEVMKLTRGERSAKLELRTIIRVAALKDFSTNLLTRRHAP